MSFVDPGDFSALQVVDETDMDNIRNDLLFLNANIVPTGAVFPFIATTAPTGYLVCDGTAVNRITYASLYALIGDAYGAGNGSTTFNLPDLQFKFPLGKAASGTGSSMGSTGGTKDAINVSHNHTQNSHDHTQDAHNHTQDAHGHTADDDNQGPTTHFVDGDSGNRVAVSHGAAANGLHPSGPEKATFSDIDAHSQHNHAITVNNSTATNQATTANNQVTTATNNSAGSSGTDQNLPPYQVFTYIIKT